MRARCFVLASLVAATLVVETDRAAAEVRVVRRDGAEACPDPDSFAARARDGATLDPSRDVVVTFAPSAIGYASTIQTSDGMQRALEDPACDALGEAALVVVKLALAPPEPHGDVEPALSTPPARDEPEPAKRPAGPPPSEPSPVGFELSAGGALAAGLGAPFAPGARVGGSLLLGHGRFSVGATGMWLAPSVRPLQDGEVTIDLAGGGLEACRRLSSRDVTGGLCARAELYRLAGTARGFSTNESHAVPLATAGLVARGQLRVSGPIGLYLELGAAVPIVRQTFEIQRIGRVYDPPAVAATGAAGAVVDFR